ncbi:MAG: hypothetical protein ACTSRP_15740 [Candidatus Helarchaeota archaeon]
MFFELIEFESCIADPFWKIFSNKDKFNSINFYGNEIKIKRKRINPHTFGFLINYIYTYNNLYTKEFSIIIHKKLNFFLLETENNANFRTQIIELLNNNFKNEYYFFPKILTIKQEWNLLKLFNNYCNLIISTNKGLIELKEYLVEKEKFPIYSSIIEVNIDNLKYSIQFFNNGFNFPPRMKEDKIFKFLNQTKKILT